MSDHTPGPWEPCILDQPLAEIPAYVADCIKASGGEDFYFVKATDEKGSVDVAHVGNGPRGLANALLIAEAPTLKADNDRLRRELAEARKAREDAEQLMRDGWIEVADGPASKVYRKQRDEAREKLAEAMVSRYSHLRPDDTRAWADVLGSKVPRLDGKK